MTVKLIHRIRSERGASLSLAILLMLVCVAVSGVVLSASTAFNGQLYSQGKMDARYYSVKSAAELFQSVVTNDKVTIESKSDGSIENAGHEHASGMGESFQNTVLYGITSTLYEDGGPLSMSPNTGWTKTIRYDITPSDFGTSASPSLKVKAACVYNSYGGITAVFSNDTSDGSGTKESEKIKVVVMLEPDIQQYTRDDSSGILVTEITWSVLQVDMG